MCTPTLAAGLEVRDDKFVFGAKVVAGGDWHVVIKADGIPPAW
jgi:hypothetical protein